LNNTGRPSSLAIVAALFSVYVLWGGTYLAMRFSIETLPPFLMAGTRFLTAGLLLYIVELGRGAASPPGHQWKSAGIAGALLLLGGNGCVVWSQQIVPSGLTAILVATVPLWMALFSWAAPGGRRPGRITMLGLMLGFGGIVLLVAGNSYSDLSTATIPWFGYLTLTAASVSWSLGSLYARRASLPTSPWMSIAMQMIIGGSLLWAAGLAAGEWSVLNLGSVSPRSLLAFG
jgi:drug/metabolite transporter (DMT)-like permease